MCVCVCARVFDETYIEPKAETRRKEEVNDEEEKEGGGEGGGGGQEQGDMLESSGLQRVTEGRGKENGRGAVDCVEDVWLAVQRRRPGVPRRSFGISLTPSLIISLFLCGLAGFVAGSGMHLTSRGHRIPSGYLQPRTPDTVDVRSCSRVCALSRAREVFVRFDG